MTVNAQGETSHIVRHVFRLFARLFPFRPPPGKESVTAAQLRPQYRRWEIATVVLLFACAPFTIWGAKRLLTALYPRPSTPAGALQHVTIDPMFFLLPAIFLGLILAAAPVMGLLYLMLRRRFSEYLLYGNLLAGFDATKIWWWLAVIFAAISLGLAYGAAHAHLTLFPDRIELENFGAHQAKSIPVAAVKSATVDANGVLRLGFVDGTTWSTADGMSLLDATPEQKRAIADYLSSHR